MKTNVSLSKCAYLIAAVLLAGGLSACSTPDTKVDFSLRHDSMEDRAVDNVRTAKVYRDLDTIMIADVFWYSPGMKKEYLEEMKREGRVDEEGAKEELRQIDEQAGKETEFIAGIYTGEKKWNDFAEKGTIWKVRLKGADGRLIEPSKVEKIKVEEMPDSHLFRFITHWKEVYRFTFPKPGAEGMTGYTLNIYSILGEAEFDWNG